MSVTEKLEKALNDFMGEINERLDSQKTMVFDVEQLVEQAFGAGAKAAATLIKNAETNSMRRHSVAHALGGLLANSGGPVQANPMSATGYANTNAADVAAWAYELADAMLREREK